MGKVLGIESLTPEWFAHRKPRLTGTDIAALMSYSPYRTSLEVWARLTGKHDAEPLDEELHHLKRGRYLEPACAQWYADETESKLESFGWRIGWDGTGAAPPLRNTLSPGLIADGEFDWLVTTPDCGIIRPDGEAGALECKAPGIHKSKEWDWDVNLAFQIQLMVHLRCWDRDWGAVAALLADDFRYKTMPRNDHFLEEMVSFILDWREKYWLKDIQPPAVPEDFKLLGELHKDRRPTIVIFGNNLCALAEEDKELKTLEGATVKRRKEIKTQVREAMGNATYGQVGPRDYYKENTYTAHYKAKEAYDADRSSLIRVTKAPGATPGEKIDVAAPVFEEPV